jgi:hypothetical protein
MPSIDNSLNVINSFILQQQGSAPTTPPSGKWRLYTKADGLYTVDDAGTEVGPLTGAGSSVGFANPMTALGDIIYGGASGSASALARGSTGQVLTMSSGSTPGWAAAAAGGGNSTATGTWSSGSAGFGTAGNLYFPSDAQMLLRDTGSAWAGWGPLFPLTKPPVVADWTIVNQDGATITDIGTGIELIDPGKNGHSFTILKKAAPATPFTITACFLPTRVGPTTAVHSAFGICGRASGSGKIVALYDGCVTTLGAIVNKWTNETTYSGEYITVTKYNTGLIWHRYVDDGTNRKFYISQDGRNFILIHSVGRTDFATCDEIGWYSNAYDTSAAFQTSVLLLSWKEA